MNDTLDTDQSWDDFLMDAGLIMFWLDSQNAIASLYAPTTLQ